MNIPAVTALHTPHPLLAFFDGIGGPELLLVFVVVLIFFGGEKLPELARGMGKAVREFKKAAGDVEKEFKRAMDEVPVKPDQAFLKPAASSIPQAPAPVMPAPPPPSNRAPRGGEPPSDHGIEA
jgi:TatA/E family protein of Tat protein translocase